MATPILSKHIRSISSPTIPPSRTKKKLLRRSIKVIVRFRPTNQTEKGLKKQNKQTTNFKYDISYLSKHQIKCMSTTSGKSYQYKFDKILPPSTSQEATFHDVGKPICDEVLKGHKGSILVYGQSGSGKTYTMFGNMSNMDQITKTDEIYESKQDVNFGLIPISCSYLFNELKLFKENKKIRSYSIKCQFVEIYNEKLKDLLSPKQTPQIREIQKNKKYIPVLTNITTKKVNNLSTCLGLIELAISNRKIASTNLNKESSRGHMVMTVIVSIETAEYRKKIGIAHFADLAGSEKVKKTGADSEQLKEAGNINKTLSTLSSVINALEKKKKYIPFKDSKLTFMLKNSLSSNNCKTILLLCASPHFYNRNETINTLQFGMRCKNIRQTISTTDHIPNVSKRGLIKENEKLRMEMKKYNEIELINSDLQKQINVLTQQLTELANDNKTNDNKKKKKDRRYNTALLRFADINRVVDNGYKALEGCGGIILKDGRYPIYRFVHDIEPIHKIVSISWNKKDDIENVGYINVNDNNWNGSIPITHATKSNVKFYGCYLDPSPQDKEIPYIKCKNGGMFDFNYTQYYDEWIQQRDGQNGSGGTRIERHEFAHVETPLSREGESGVFVMGKEIEDGKLALTAFIIARGQTLYVPPNTIHTNDYQRGTWRTYLESDADIDIVDVVRVDEETNYKQHISFKFYCGITKKRMSQYELPISIHKFANNTSTVDSYNIHDTNNNYNSNDPLMEENNYQQISNQYYRQLSLKMMDTETINQFHDITNNDDDDDDDDDHDNDFDNDFHDDYDDDVLTIQ